MILRFGVHIHPTLLKINVAPLANAVAPVNTISVPYPVPYPPAAWPCHGIPFINAPLNGPDAMFPIPRPAERTPSTMAGSNDVPLVRVLEGVDDTICMMPVQADVYEPAKMP